MTSVKSTRRVAQASALSVAVLLTVVSCKDAGPPPVNTPVAQVSAATITVRDTTIDAGFSASGTANAFREATLGTTLSGSVTDVLVHEGQRVRRGERLANIDSRDVRARITQADAGVQAAQAMRDQASAQVKRIRALFADSAAPRVQLEGAEAAFASSEAALASARAGRSQLDVMQGYAEVVAPFDGVIARRMIDPGSFVGPGTPLITVQDLSRLRVTVNVTPDEARGLKAGRVIPAQIERTRVNATIEGVVPAAGGGMTTVNALVTNTDGTLLPGSSATLLLSGSSRTALLIPERALVRSGDLVGVYLRDGTGNGASARTIRWLTVARVDGAHVEVLSGLRAGDIIELPSLNTEKR